MYILLFLSLLLQQAKPSTPKAKSENNPNDKPVTATIRGKVTAADTGAGVKGAQVSVQKMGQGGQQSGYATTDATGQFEIKNIDPGTYFASAGKTGYLYKTYQKSGNDNPALILTENQEVNDVNFLLTRAGVISGTVTDEFDEPLPNVMVQAMWKNYYQGKMQIQPMASATTDDRGQFRIHDLRPGRYYIRAGKNTGPNMIAHYYPVLYPNATRIADAQMLKLGEGEEVGGIKLAMRESTVYTVSGKVVDERTGQPVAGAFLNVNPEDYTAGGSMANAQTQPNGTFRLTQMSPGRYMLWIQAPTPGARGQQRPIQQLLEMPERNVSDMTLVIGPGATVKGVIGADGGDLPQKLNVQMIQRTSGGNYLNNQQAQTAPDGTFEITDLQAGTYEVQVFNPMGPGQASGPQTYFYTSSITVGGHDVTDSGVQIAQGVTSVEMQARIDFRAGTVSGKTLDADGNPLPRATIVMLPTDPNKRDGIRYFKMGRSDTTGMYKIGAVIPGDYLILVWPQQDPYTLLDPDNMKMVERYFVSVSVSASATVSQELKLNSDVQKVALSLGQQQ